MVDNIQEDIHGDQSVDNIQVVQEWGNIQWDNILEVQMLVVVNIKLEELVLEQGNILEVQVPGIIQVAEQERVPVQDNIQEEWVQDNILAVNSLEE